MKKILIALGALVVLLVLAVAGIIGYFSSKWQPHYMDIPTPDITASTDSAIIAEGKYLVNAVAHCTACHLPKEKVFNASPEDVDDFLPTGGGEWVMGPLGTVRSVNITPHPETGIGNWSDGDIAKAMKYGIDPKGRGLLFMIGVGPMGDEDLQAIISYLRSIEPVENLVPRSEVAALGKVLLQTVMKGFVRPKPDIAIDYVPRGDTSIARGEYLANGPGMCFGCHSNSQMSPELAIVGPPFAGNLRADPDPENPGMEINAPNLTPSEKYGVLAKWTEEQFLARIQAGRAVQNSPMPWENFRLMTDGDLLSIFRYLKSLDPVDRNTGPGYRKKGWEPAEG